MSIHQGRANTKATPEAVFAACAKLAASNPDFRNEDVLSITGGGMSVVSRLVRIYRENQAVIEACEELDASTAINLVQATNALLANHKAKSKAALDAANETYLLTIAELAEENARLGEELKIAQDQTAKEIETANTLRTDYDKTLQALNARNQELQLSKTNEQKLLSAQAALQEKHESKIDALNTRHADKLASALEAQRKTFEAEKELAIRTANTSLEAARQSDLQKIEALESGASKLNDALTQITKEKESLRLECTAQHDRLIELQKTMDEALAEKREQLKEAQRLYGQLIATFKSQQDMQAEYIADNLSAANKSANTLRPLLDELTEKLDQLLVKGNKE